MGAIGTVEIKLDKQTIMLDLHKITIGEFRFATKAGTGEDESDEIVAKACGLTRAELQALSQPDYRKVINEWWNAATQPIDDTRWLKLTADQATAFGVKFGQTVLIVQDGAEPAPNSPSASIKG